MHKRGVFHRDIKPENILIEVRASASSESFFANAGRPTPIPPRSPRCTQSTYDVYTGLKLADFGSCRGMCVRAQLLDASLCYLYIL